MRTLRLAVLGLGLVAGCPAPEARPDAATPNDAPPALDAGADASIPDAAPADAARAPDAPEGGCAAAEICGNGIDDDCDGATDAVPDLDGDGWTRCTGDCCETTSECAVPALVGPGAYDWPGDGVDDDCSGTPDDVASCDDALASDAADPRLYGAALGLCETTSESGRGWGLVSASFVLADGTGAPSPQSRALRPNFGAAITPREGSAMVVLSSGHAASPAQVSPGYSPFDSTILGTTSGLPAGWLAAHGGVPPTVSSCPAPTDTVAYDSVRLRLRIRVPANARALALDTFLLSSELPEWVCSAYSDYAVVLLSSSYVAGASEPPNPADGNLAQLDTGTARFPLGTNAAAMNSGLFTACVNGATGCGDVSIAAGTLTTCTGTSLLAGTGFDLAAPGSCDGGSLLGGGTGWLTVQGNVVPGEIIELSLAVWDSSDARLDSVALFDALRWLPAPVASGIEVR